MDRYYDQLCQHFFGRDADLYLLAKAEIKKSEYAALPKLRAFIQKIPPRNDKWIFERLRDAAMDNYAIWKIWRERHPHTIIPQRFFTTTQQVIDTIEDAEYWFSTTHGNLTYIPHIIRLMAAGEFDVPRKLVKSRANYEVLYSPRLLMVLFGTDEEVAAIASETILVIHRGIEFSGNLDDVATDFIVPTRLAHLRYIRRPITRALVWRFLHIAWKYVPVAEQQQLLQFFAAETMHIEGFGKKLLMFPAVKPGNFYAAQYQARFFHNANSGVISGALIGLRRRFLMSRKTALRRMSDAVFLDVKAPPAACISGAIAAVVNSAVFIGWE